MIAHTGHSPAPSVSTKTETSVQFCLLYRQRQDALNLIKQLIQMIKTVQRHRGMSMALLGGNTLFRAEFGHLQQQLERRLMSLQTFAAHTDKLLSARDQQNLRSAWVTISHDWQQDSVIDNYELHCHLLAQLLGMLATLAKQLEQPVSKLIDAHFQSNSVGGDNAAYPNRFQYLEVLHFSTRLMPDVVEQIGRIRALSTYAAAIGHCDSHHDNKLRYVIQCTRVNNEKLRHQAKRMETLGDGKIGLPGQLKSYEIKLLFLLDMVEQDVLNHTTITTDSNRLFHLATDIIDFYLTLTEDGIVLINRWHEQDLENWLQSS